MLIHMLAVGDKMPAWVEQGFEDYRSRLRQDVQLRLDAVSLGKRKDKQHLQQTIAAESAALAARIPKGAYCVVLDVQGRMYSSEELAARLEYWQGLGRELALIVGGPEGLSQELRQSADELWSLSRLTLPHPLVRIVLVEALYRAWAIMHHHPYHRA